MSQDELLARSETAVVDAYSLYRIALGHTPRGTVLRNAALTGDIRLVVPAFSFGVACAMRTCWDDECDQLHPPGAGAAIRRFLGGRGVETAEPTPEATVAAGQLYADCAQRRVTGAEVLAACHTVVLAGDRGTPLVSAVRAAYCYLPLADRRPGFRIDYV
ncbi:hypothetical protein [Streptomyces albidoflavus]|uniref:hypothetical protein n=1 Tax=Streptomyces albidoflavus TaxID=1886 RepID=UPI00331E0C7B